MAAVLLGSKAVGSIVKIGVNGTPRNFIVVQHGRPSVSETTYSANMDNTVWLLTEDCYVSMQLGTGDPRDQDLAYVWSLVHSYLNGEFLGLIDANIRNRLVPVSITEPQTGTLSASAVLLSWREAGGGGLSYFSPPLQSKLIANLNGNPTRWWTRTHVYHEYVGQNYPCRFNTFSVAGSSDSTDYNVFGVGVRPAIFLPTSLYVDDNGFVITDTAPSVPPSITVPTSIIYGQAFTVSWGASSGTSIGGYRLERQINGGAWTQIQDGVGTSKSETLSRDQASTVAYRVKAYSSGGLESGYQTGATHTVINNRAPSAPVSITVPATVMGGKTLAVSWANGSDPDGDALATKLERRVNGGAWGQIYQGAALSFTDTVPVGAWSTVEYQVRVYDTYGEHSGYTASTACVVVNNNPPVISGGNGDLGNLTATGLTYGYTVTDDLSASVTITERLGGVTLRTFTAASGASNTLTLTGGAWTKVLNGRHTVTIAATDQYGDSSVRTLTFTKDTDGIEFITKDPRPMLDMPTLILLDVAGVFPATAIEAYFICNNGFDAVPAWEDVTAIVKNGLAHTFVNTGKTAENWGVRIRVKIDRGNAPGDCYVYGLTYAYKTDGDAVDAQIAALTAQGQQTDELLELLLTQILPQLMGEGATL